jgi:chemotaxis protein CheX
VVEEQTQTQLSASLNNAVTEVFTSMLGTEVAIREEATEPVLPQPHDGVLALIGLAGQWVGSGVMFCQARTACDLASRLLMAEYSEVNDDVRDAIGEITNMVIGNFKNCLESETVEVRISTPTVIDGTRLKARNLSSDITVSTWYAYEGHVFLVELCLARL